MSHAHIHTRTHAYTLILTGQGKKREEGKKRGTKGKRRRNRKKRTEESKEEETPEGKKE